MLEGLGGGEAFCNLNKLQGYRGITLKGDQVNCPTCQIMIPLLLCKEIMNWERACEVFQLQETSSKQSLTCLFLDQCILNFSSSTLLKRLQFKCVTYLCSLWLWKCCESALQLRGAVAVWAQWGTCSTLCGLCRLALLMLCWHPFPTWTKQGCAGGQSCLADAWGAFWGCFPS